MTDDELKELYLQLDTRITALSGLVVGTIMSVERSQPGTIDLMISAFRSITARPVEDGDEYATLTRVAENDLLDRLLEASRGLHD